MLLLMKTLLHLRRRQGSALGLPFLLRFLVTALRNHVPASSEECIADARTAESIGKGDVSPHVMLAVGAVVEEVTEDARHTRPAGDETEAGRLAEELGKVIAGMLVQATYGAHAGNERMKQDVLAATTNHHQGHEIGQDDLEEEVRRRHVASADGLGSPRRVVKGVSQQTHEGHNRLVEEEPVRGVLDDIMADGHGRQRQEETGARKLPGLTCEAEAQSFGGQHCGKQDEALVQENLG